MVYMLFEGLIPLSGTAYARRSTWKSTLRIRRVRFGQQPLTL